MPKPPPDIRQEYEEGPEAGEHFNAVVRGILTIPKPTVDRIIRANAAKRAPRTRTSR